jgi:ABC-2 type transport system permease protein
MTSSAVPEPQPGQAQQAPSWVLPEVIRTRDAGGRLWDDLRAIGIVWRRELIRFFRNRTRLVTSFAQPILFLFVLGTGLSRIFPSSTAAHVDFRTFIFPGVLAMTVLFTAIFSAVSIVWDREFGFLREMLVAPVRRSALIIGKCLGGATVATIQGTIMLVLAGLVHVPYSPALMVTLILEMALAAFVITATGIMLASRIGQVETFQPVVQFFVMPMFFLSGALFPLIGLPSWLLVLTKIDPLTYAVDPMRRAIFSHVLVPPTVANVMGSGMTWGGWRLPVAFELALIGGLGVLFLSIAVIRFSKQE